MDIELVVNGRSQRVHAHPLARLLDVLREQLGLCGTKEGCGEGECGACSVLIDDVLVNACLVPVGQCEGSRVDTIEGIGADPRVAALQRAFVDVGGAQCGICTPGMIVAASALVRTRPRATPAEIRTALAGNLCRCTGYVRIVDAVAQACGAGESEGGA
ncbi:MAG: (2Fe-2S)-binding protein [Nannocystaceae bacterium]|nr:(2Fe-2S)-binding protein [Nannocystaceae bacterium]